MRWLRVEDLNLYLLVQSQPSCRLDEPEVWILDFRFWILDWKRNLAIPVRQSKIQNLKSKMVKTEGLEPSTLSFEARRSDSVELRLRIALAGRVRFTINRT